MRATANAGGCLCGAVAYRTTGEPRWIGLCHCRSCRRATGGILTAAAGFRRADVVFPKERPRTYGSSAGVRRGFCATCGTTLTYESDRWPDDIHIMVATFERPDLLEPQFHIFAAERVPWLDLHDPLPRYLGTPGEGRLIAEPPI